MPSSQQPSVTQPDSEPGYGYSRAQPGYPSDYAAAHQMSSSHTQAAGTSGTNPAQASVASPALQSSPYQQGSQLANSSPGPYSNVIAQVQYSQTPPGQIQGYHSPAVQSVSASPAAPGAGTGQAAYSQQPTLGYHTHTPNPQSGQSQPKLPGFVLNASVEPSASGPTNPASPPESGAAGEPHPSTSKPVITCIENTDVPIGTTWYTHPSVPNFPICSRCWTDHLSTSPFAQHFRGDFVDDGIARRCYFSKPRCLMLWEQVRSSRSLDPLLHWMQRRSGIVECPGAQGTAKPPPDQGWFTDSRNEMGALGFRVCEACYEDYVLVQSSYADNIVAIPAQQQQQQQQQVEQNTACSMATPYIRRLYRDLPTKNIPWAQFVEETKARLSLPPCPKLNEICPVSGGQRVFIPKPGQGPSNLILCVSCFCDWFNLTTDAHRWVEASLSSLRNGKSKCSMGSLNILLPMLRAAQDLKNYSIFWSVASKVLQHPECSGRGITDGEWWTFPSDPKEFGICGGCFEGIIRLYNIDRDNVSDTNSAVPTAAAATAVAPPTFIRKPNVRPGSTLLCCLNPSTPRFLTGYAPEVSRATFTSDVSSLRRYVEMFSAVPVCPTTRIYAERRKEERRWWGWEDLSVCEDCWLSFVSSKFLPSVAMPMNGELRNETRVCDLYSSRMRTLWKEVFPPSSFTSPNNPQQQQGLQTKLQALLLFTSQRRKVLIECVEGIFKLQLQQQEQQTQMHMLGTMGSFYSQLGQNESVMMGSTGIWSNSAVGGGYHNQNELQGATYSKQSQDMMFASLSGVGAVQEQVRRLLARWESVE